MPKWTTAQHVKFRKTMQARRKRQAKASPAPMHNPETVYIMEADGKLARYVGRSMLVFRREDEKGNPPQ